MCRMGGGGGQTEGALKQQNGDGARVEHGRWLGLSDTITGSSLDLSFFA